MALSGKELLFYGCNKFEEGSYGEALEAFVLAYEKGYEKDWILNNIYSCYMAGNEQEFRASYEECGIYGEISYEMCSLDFIPYKESEYFIYDKLEQKFRGSISVREIEEVGEPNQEFSDLSAEFEWDWRQYKEILKWALQRKIYVICQDKKRAVSFCKIPELRDYLKKIIFFENQEEYQQYFHSHTDVYLPRIFLGRVEKQQELMKIWQEEHAYRLTPEGRNTSNVLLSIGIPTHDRGHLALQKVKILLNMPYDAEIEIAVSKNGVTLYQEDYHQLGRISDARLCYKDHDKELKMQLNWRRTAELAKGKYLMFVSDEDDVLQESLEHYLSVLAKNPELVFIKARTVVQYPNLSTKETKKGIEAFKEIFLGNNYLSGRIVKREIFLNLPFEKIETYAANNIFYAYYAHEWWFSLLSFEGNCRSDEVCLISEGEDIRDAENEAMLKRGKYELTAPREGMILDYATYRSRLEQFKGYISFIHFIEDKGIDIVKAGVMNAMAKTPYMLRLAYEYNYRKNEFAGALEQYGRLCLWAVEEFKFNEEQKIEILNWAMYCIGDVELR